MVSSGNKGGDLLDKVMVSARIPRYIKEYADKHNLSISQLLVKGFDSYRETDVEHAFERLSYHEKRVLHWRHIVLQQDEECNTKQRICNTIKADFLANGRGNKETYRMDMNWVKAKAEQLVNEGVIISPQELYDFCVNREKKE